MVFIVQGMGRDAVQKARLAQEIAARMTQAASIQKAPAPAPDSNLALSLAAVAQAAANQLAQQARPLLHLLELPLLLD